MKRMNTVPGGFAGIVLTALCMCTGCASVQPPAAGTAGTSAQKEYALSNGIPVYVKENDASQLVTVYIVIKGGTALLAPEQSGLENSLAEMMKDGSASYTYESIQKLMYRTQSGFFSFALNEGSGLGIECIDYYLDDMLPVLVDGLLHPAYGQKEYETMMNEYNQMLQTRMNDPQSLCFYTMTHTLYKGHPYQTEVQPTAKSMQYITVENMKNLHEKLLDARRIAVIAAGKVDGKKLAASLEKTLGTIPAGSGAFTVPVIPPVQVTGAPVVQTLEAAKGTGIMIQAFASPAVTDKDSIAAALAADMYGDILFRIVREKYGACYTPWCGLEPSAASVGMVALISVSNLEKASQYVQEAQALMAQGKVIVGKDEGGNFQYASIADRLESYKNSYINSRYESVQTSRGVAGRMAGSLLAYGDTRTSDTVVDKARAVTAEDISRVFDTYWVKGSKQWFAVVGPGDEKRIKF